MKGYSSLPSPPLHFPLFFLCFSFAAASSSFCFSCFISSDFLSLSLSLSLFNIPEQSWSWWLFLCWVFLQ
ncbi:hypothetical protein FF1_003392 [Malus domestica]